MNERGKSDSPVVPAKPPNKTSVAEVVEERGLAKGNTASKARPGHRAGSGVSQALDRVREIARKDKEARFTALLHHVDVSRLRAAYWAIRPQAAPGVDGVTWEAYGQDLEANLQDLHGRLHTGRYRASPSRRVYIPKADGRLRPLGIATLEDKIVQRAVVEVLNAVYEVDFRGFSYGFRPGRSPHRCVGCARGRDRAEEGELGARRGHPRLLRPASTIAGWRSSLSTGSRTNGSCGSSDKWLSAGVIEDGAWTASEEGAPQGASASPLLANVYLHYVLDLWVQWWRRRYAHGDVIIVRFADDFVVGLRASGRMRSGSWPTFASGSRSSGWSCTRQDPADRVRAARRLESGQRGVPGKPETFDFLGFTHICGKTKSGRFWLQAHHDREADAGEATRGQDRAEATPTSTHPGARAMATQRGARSPRLLRRARQHRRGRGLPHPGDPALVQGAAAPQPAHTDELGADEPHRETMATTSPRDASLPERALRRQNLRQEPSAVVPHAGICAGGRPAG